MTDRPHMKSCGIAPDVRFGRNVTVVEPVNLYGCTIGDESFIGPFVEIQRDASIGRRCRIQSHAFICSMVELGDDCFVSHGAKFVNDRFRGGTRAHGRTESYEETVIGAGVLIGTNATVLPVRIVSGVTVGAGAVVTKDLLVPGVYAGNPAVLLRGTNT